MSLPVTVHENFDAVELIHTPAGESVFDLGQEFAGLFTLRVHEPKGTRIHVQTGEILPTMDTAMQKLKVSLI